MTTDSEIRKLCEEELEKELGFSVRKEPLGNGYSWIHVRTPLADRSVEATHGWALWNALVDRASLLRERMEEERWTKDVPTEQGDYWHWSGSPDDAPFLLDVMWSGTKNACFVCIKDMDGAPWCDEVGGWWMRVKQPALPSAPEVKG